MSLILDTSDNNSYLTHIIEDSRKHLILICPYLKINQKLRRTIEVADSRGVRLFVIYGKRELDPDTLTWLKGLRNCSIASIKDLHAKVYMNGDLAIVTSMNLYEYSQVNNEEIGVLCGRRQDRLEFKDLTFQVMRLISLSVKEHGEWDTEDIGKPIRGLFGRNRNMFSEVDDPRKSEYPYEFVGLETGVEDSSGRDEPVESRIICHCIRCGRAIPSEHDYVYCGRCMESWKRYCNTGYVEPDGHCYICGRSHRGSAEKPACMECYKGNTELVNRKCEVMRKVSAEKARDP